MAKTVVNIKQNEIKIVTVGIQRPPETDEIVKLLAILSNPMLDTDVRVDTINTNTATIPTDMWADDKALTPQKFMGLK